MPLAAFEGWVPLAEAVVGDIGLHAVLLGCLYVVLAVVLAIGGKVGSGERAVLQLALLEVFLGLVQGSPGELLVVAGGFDSSGDDNLVFLLY